MVLYCSYVSGTYPTFAIEYTFVAAVDDYILFFPVSLLIHTEIRQLKEHQIETREKAEQEKRTHPL